MLELLALPFFQNAILAGILVSIACGIIGSLVVVNRSVFLAGGIAHAAYGGVGLAFFFALPAFPTIVIFSVVIAIIMAALSLNRRERTDAIIGVLWAIGMAIGIILIDLSPGYNVDLMSYLFGSILTVPASDLKFMAVLDLIIIGVILFYYKNFIAMSYDREFAKVRGVPVKKLHFLFLVMVAICIVMSIRAVGLILIMALLTIAPFLAEQVSKSLLQMMAISSGLNVGFVILGLFISYFFDLTSGATIILVAGIFFVIFQVTLRIVKTKKAL